MASEPVTRPRPDDDSDLVAVGVDPIDVGVVLDAVADPAAGASVLFVGTVRDHSIGADGTPLSDVTHLEYEAYEELVEGVIADVLDQVRRQWPEVCRLAALHRIGSVSVGEISVAVAVSAPHRPTAFDAGRFLIDRLKSTAPIWKKEHWPGGSEWVREDLRHKNASE